MDKKLKILVSTIIFIYKKCLPRYVKYSEIWPFRYFLSGNSFHSVDWNTMISTKLFNFSWRLFRCAAISKLHFKCYNPQQRFLSCILKKINRCYNKASLGFPLVSTIKISRRIFSSILALASVIYFFILLLHSKPQITDSRTKIENIFMVPTKGNPIETLIQQ